MSKPIIFISAPLTTSDKVLWHKRIHDADDIALRCMLKGWTPVCPHKLFEGYENVDALSYQDFLDSCLDLIERCHALCLGTGWQNSMGSRKEYNCAKNNGLPIYNVDTVPDAKDFKFSSVDYVIYDIFARRKKGVQSYGKQLYPRECLQDVKEELQDALIYFTASTFQK